MRTINAYRLLLSATMMWCLLLLAPPLLSFVEDSTHFYSQSVYHFFSPVCHQFDERSFHLFGMKLAVCSRCSGIYFGFFLGVLYYPFRARKQILRTSVMWAIGILPMLADVLLDISGLHESTLVTRLCTGLLFGIIASLILTPMFLEGVAQVFYHSSTTQRISHESKA